MLTVDPGSPIPPYEQLRRQLVDQIGSRQLAIGTKLPPVRRLAADLGLSPNTVARTYRELESQGYVRTHGRNGTVVGLAEPDRQRTEHIAGLVEHYVTGMRALGIEPDAIVGHVRRALAP